MRTRSTSILLVALALIVGSAACSNGSNPTGGGKETQGTGSPLDPTGVRLHQIAKVTAPIALAPRSGSDDLYVAEQSGKIRRIEVKTSGDSPSSYELDSTPVLDLSDDTKASGERGLLGLAFSPDGNLLYVDFTDQQGDSHIVEYRMDGDRADPASARELLFVNQPFPNHNGGQLAFGPDGFLYIGFGDGGSGGDPGNRAQNTQELLGKILRIDPSGRTGDLPYAIPSGNPFADGQGGRPEIWLYGVRNPWRFSFDRTTNDLWVGDVGQDTWEEVDFLPASGAGAGNGDNLGWPYMEATHHFKGDPPPNLVAPVYEYSHDDGSCSVIGGFVYRGPAIPDLAGTYLFGDYCTSDVLGLRLTGGTQADTASLGVSVPANSLSSFGQDNDGELYVLSTEGPVFKVEPA